MYIVACTSLSEAINQLLHIVIQTLLSQAIIVHCKICTLLSQAVISHCNTDTDVYPLSKLQEQVH